MSINRDFCVNQSGGSFGKPLMLTDMRVQIPSRAALNVVALSAKK